MKLRIRLICLSWLFVATAAAAYEYSWVDGPSPVDRQVEGICLAAIDGGEYPGSLVNEGAVEKCRVVTPAGPHEVAEGYRILVGHGSVQWRAFWTSYPFLGGRSSGGEDLYVCRLPMRTGRFEYGHAALKGKLCIGNVDGEVVELQRYHTLNGKLVEWNEAAPGADSDTEGSDADTDTEGSDADTDTEESDADTDTEGSDADTDTEESDADTDTEGSDADTDTEGSDADTDTEGSDTEDSESGDTDTEDSDTEDSATEDSDTESDTGTKGSVERDPEE